MPTHTRIPASALRPGDIVGSGETVVSVSAGVRTPSGKVDVILARAGARRTACWGARTLIGVAPAALPGIAPATERERIEARAARPMTAKAPQRPLDFGLFGSERDQLDLVDAVRAARSGPGR